VSEEEESVIRESYFQGVKKVVNPHTKAGIKQLAFAKRSLLQNGINISSTASLSLYSTASTSSFVPLSDTEQQPDPLQQELLNKKWKVSFEKKAKKRHIRKFMVGITFQVDKDKDPIIYSIEPSLMQKISGNAPQPKIRSLFAGGKKVQAPNPTLQAKQANLLALHVSKSKQAIISSNIPSRLSIQENSSVEKPKPKAVVQPKNAINAASHQCQVKKKIPIIDRKYKGVISCSHPKLQWTSAPLLAAPDTAFSVLKQYDSPSKLEQGIGFMQIPELNCHKLIIPFSFVILNNALKKDIFKLSAEHHVTLALFLNAFRPDQIKTSVLLQQAASLFPGWSNRWIIFRMMRV
ncbi:MAG: hypothetical protein EZS28_046114, partial [Streblomastix strix]